MVFQDGYWLTVDFTKSESNPNLYYIFVETNLLYLVLYVDDLFLTNAKKLIAGCKAHMAVEFEMNGINTMHYFVALDVWQKPRQIFLGQGKYAIEILKRFRMEDYKLWTHS